MAIALTLDITKASDCKSLTIAETTGAYNSTTNLGGYNSPNFTVADVTAATIDFTRLNSTNTYTVDVYPTLPTTSSSTTFLIDSSDVGFGSGEAISDGIYELTYTVTGHFNITALSTGSKTFTVAGDKTEVFAIGDTFEITGSTNNNSTFTIVDITLSAGNTIFTVSETVGATVDGQINFSFNTSYHLIFCCTATCCLNDKRSQLDNCECSDCNDDLLNLINKIRTFLEAAIDAANCGKPNKADKLLTYVNTLCSLTKCTTC